MSSLMVVEHEAMFSIVGFLASYTLGAIGSHIETKKKFVFG
jgi:hypothetical protein